MSRILRLAEDENDQQPRQRRRYRDRIDCFTVFRDEEIRQRYRFTRTSIQYIVELVQNDIQRDTNRCHAVSPLEQVLVALRLYACGSFQQVIGDATVQLDKSTCCRALWDVTKSLNKRLDEYIFMPTGERLKAVQNGFEQSCRIPGVVGCIDCTHVRIQGPSENEWEFVNRKNFHSLNVQAICDHESYLININSNWPGRTHDSRVLSESQVGNEFDQGLRSGILLGDSGYPLRPWLLTPYLNPSTRGQSRYNSAHSSTRSIIERTFGQLKRRFHCLHGELRYQPQKASWIVTACCILHNVAKMFKEEDFEPVGPEPDVEELPFVGAVSGKLFRDQIVDAYFN